MIKHILAPLDGSKMSESALSVAAMLALKAGAKVTLLHVVERRPPRNVHGDRHLQTSDEAQAYLADLAAKAFPPGVTVEWHVHSPRTLNVPQSLAEHVEEFAPDLIVMCAHGPSRVKDFLRGNIAQRMLRHAIAPLLLVRSTQALRPEFREILVPLDGTPEHEQGLPLAGEIASLCDSMLRLLTVSPTAVSLTGPQALAAELLPRATEEVLDLRQEQAKEYLARQVESLERKKISVRACLVRARKPAEKVIAQMADELPADLVVLSTHGRSGTRAFWAGSLAAKVLRSVKASLLLAPAKK